jgi:hypothetical protein
MNRFLGRNLFDVTHLMSVRTDDGSVLPHAGVTGGAVAYWHLYHDQRIVA